MRRGRGEIAFPRLTTGCSPPHWLRINCSETPDERDELHKSGWRIVDFKGLFDVDLAKPASFVASQGPAASTLGGQQSTSSDDVFASRAARYRTFIKPGSKHVFDPFKKILQQGESPFPGTNVGAALTLQSSQSPKCA